MSAENKKKPSLYARKLVEKLRSLNSNASLESRQTIANWMIFNRKKAEGMGEGLLLAIDDAATVAKDASAAEGSSSTSPAPRLMLLLRVVHQVFVEGTDDDDSNKDTATAAADSDVFEKSSQLRLTVADLALIPLFKALALATNSNNYSDAAAESSEWNNFQNEVKEMIDIWKKHNVFGGPTVWEGYKKAWARAIADANKEKKNAAAAVTVAAVVVGEESDKKGTTFEYEPMDEDDKGVEVVGELSVEGKGAQQQQQQHPPTSSAKQEERVDESNDKNSSIIDAVNEENTTKEESTTVDDVVENNNEKEEEPQRILSKRDSFEQSNFDIDFDAEGVEEAEVEPSKFLEASRVIASLQIARGKLLLYVFVCLKGCRENTEKCT